MRQKFLLILLFWGTVVWASELRTYQGFVLMNDPGTRSWVIRNESELESFRRLLPDLLPQKKQPAPPNNDPIRTDRFDFSKEMIIVAGHGDNLSARPEFVEVREDDRIEAVWSLPEKPPEAKPYGWGTYSAVVLPASDKEVVFRWKQEKI